MATTLPSNVPFEPKADYVLLEPIEQNMTAGGLALPEGASTNPPCAKVVKVGPGRYTETGELIEMRVEPGEVVYLAFAYSEPVGIELDGTKYIITRERDLIGRNPRA